MIYCLLLFKDFYLYSMFKCQELKRHPWKDMRKCQIRVNDSNVSVRQMFFWFLFLSFRFFNSIHLEYKFCLPLYLFCCVFISTVQLRTFLYRIIMCFLLSASEGHFTVAKLLSIEYLDRSIAKSYVRQKFIALFSVSIGFRYSPWASLVGCGHICGLQNINTKWKET